MKNCEFGIGKMGWLRDIPDHRDYSAVHPEIDKILSKISIGISPSIAGSGCLSDLRPWCSPIENQGNIGSCTAHAGVGILEYFEKRSFGKYLDASRMFLYKRTRDLLGWKGDTGAYLRTTMGAMVLFGVPPEKFWPYTINNLDVEPPSFVGDLAQSFQGLKYFRLDIPGVSPENLLGIIKSYICAGIPSMFGFSVYTSIRQAGEDGKIPYPGPRESLLGGHAVGAMGFCDEVEITNKSAELTTKGALLIRNSWGNWGESGYGWLPYEYILKGLAVDWWSLLSAEWIDTGQFGV